MGSFILFRTDGETTCWMLPPVRLKTLCKHTIISMGYKKWEETGEPGGNAHRLAQHPIIPVYHHSFAWEGFPLEHDCADLCPQAN